MQIHLTVHWPILSLRDTQWVQVRLLSAEGEPLLGAKHFTLGQYRYGHVTRLRIRFSPETAIRHRAIRVEIRARGKPTLLRTLDYGQADLKQSSRNKICRRKSKALLRTLQLNTVRLFVLREEKRLETKVLFETDVAFSLVFRMACFGWSAEGPLLRWRLRIELLHLDSGLTIAENRDLFIQAHKVGHARIDIRLQGKRGASPPGRYQLRLFHRERLLATLDFHRLASSEIQPYVQQLVHQSLWVEEQRLWVQSGAIRYSSELVARTSDHLHLEFTLRAAGFNRALPHLRTLLTLSLLTSQARQPLMEIPLTLHSKPISVRMMPLKIQDLSLLVGAEPCRLVASVGQKDIATFRFRLVEESELLQLVNVSNLRVHAETHHGLCVSQVERLRFGLHHAFWVSLEIQTDTLAPNTSFPVSVAIRQGETTRHWDHFKLRLDRSPQQFDFPKIAMATLNHELREPQEMKVEVFINGQQKYTHSLSLYPVQKITNYEGQLVMDPADLDVEGGEYEQILNGLGTAKSTGPRWRFWRKCA